jgi:hypothetical protein
MILSDIHRKECRVKRKSMPVATATGDTDKPKPV